MICSKSIVFNIYTKDNMEVSAFSFSEIGQKDNQEDRVYPAPQQVSSSQKYFILCDGMGGHDSGEVASATVSTALGKYFDTHPYVVADEEYFNRALSFAYDQLDLKDNGSEKKMGTTLTCVLFNPDGFLAAHIGDSRIYQFRNGQIIFKTRDHSLVNDLIKAGELTEEQARNYPRKNVITRAMQPNTHRAKADVHISNDLQDGDCFFMCCDGVLERMYEEKMIQIFGEKFTPKEKLSAIKAECDKGTKDNYTCWLIQCLEEESKVGRFNLGRVINYRLVSLILAIVTVVLTITIIRTCGDLKKTKSSIEDLDKNYTEQTLMNDNLRQNVIQLQGEIGSLQSVIDSLNSR